MILLTDQNHTTKTLKVQKKMKISKNLRVNLRGFHNNKIKEIIHLTPEVTFERSYPHKAFTNEF